MARDRDRGPLLRSGEHLTSGSYLASPGGRCFALQHSRFVIRRGSPYAQDEPVWMARPQVSPAGSHVAMQSDGNLVLYEGPPVADRTTQVLWAARNHAGPPGSYVAALDDDGTLGIYAGDVPYEPTTLTWSSTGGNTVDWRPRASDVDVGRDTLRELAMRGGRLELPRPAAAIVPRTRICVSLPLPLNRFRLHGSEMVAASTSQAPDLLPAWNEDRTAVRPTWASVPPSPAGAVEVLRSAWTGALVACFTASSDRPVTSITDASLLPPNDIGHPPQPSLGAPVPPDSPRVLVGAGILDGASAGVSAGASVGTSARAKVVTREQYWRRLGSSYSVPPREKRVLTHTRTTGKQETSTDQEQLSIGANASGGGSFGAFSASVSASLNRSSSSQHQVTVTAQSSVFESIEIDNTDHDDVLTVLVWQLTDLIDVWTVDGVHLGHVAQGQDPVVATQHRAAVPQRPRRTPDTARTPV